jgi:hypothetical protein
MRIRIPHRPSVSLVDLSVGGALIELPFQMRPDSRVTLELRTSSEQMLVPFRALRCHVAQIRDGVRYHAAGTFDQVVRLPEGIADNATATPFRLIAALEGLLRASRAATASRDERFDALVLDALAGLKRGESTHLISVKVKAFLSRQVPSLAIYPQSPFRNGDPLTTVQFFGFNFRAPRTLTASERRLLRSGAQVIAMIAEDERESNSEEPGVKAPALEVVRTAADWQGTKPSQDRIVSFNAFDSKLRRLA